MQEGLPHPVADWSSAAAHGTHGDSRAPWDSIRPNHSPLCSRPRSLSCVLIFGSREGGESTPAFMKKECLGGVSLQLGVWVYSGNGRKNPQAEGQTWGPRPASGFCRLNIPFCGFSGVSLGVELDVLSPSAQKEGPSRHFSVSTPSPPTAHSTRTTCLLSQDPHLPQQRTFWPLLPLPQQAGPGSCHPLGQASSSVSGQNRGGKSSSLSTPR